MAILQFPLDDFNAGIETAEKAFAYYATNRLDAESQADIFQTHFWD